MYDKFLNIPIDKQNTIINAALNAFGSNGYKKTSVSDIANAAGISKAMIFHYFNTKKDLYFYLLEFCSNLIMNEIKDKFDSSITDFFEKIKMSTLIKVAIIKKYPATLSFLYSVFYETNEEVKDGIAAMMSTSETFKNVFIFEGMDYTKFKDNVDVRMVMKMLMWMAEGFINPVRSIQVEDLDTICKDFFDSLDLLKNNLYKERYL